MNSKQILSLAAGLVAAGVSFVSSAQPTNTPANSQPLDRPQPPRGMVRPLEGFGPIFNVLTDEQRASMEQALQAQRGPLRELEMKIRDARRQLFEGALSGKFDDDAVRKQASVLANFEAEMTVVRVKALSQVQPPLSPDQIARIKNAPALGAGPGARPMDRPAERAARQRILLNGPRDENDLPPKP